MGLNTHGTGSYGPKGLTFGSLFLLQGACTPTSDLVVPLTRTTFLSRYHQQMKQGPLSKPIIIAFLNFATLHSPPVFNFVSSNSGP